MVILDALKASLIFYAATERSTKSRKTKAPQHRTASSRPRQKTLPHRKKSGKKSPRRTKTPHRTPQITPSQTTRERPFGISILAILMAIGGAICLLVAILFSLFSLLVGASLLEYLGVLGTTFVFVLQFFIFVFGIFLFWLAYRLWYLDSRAHTTAVLLYALSFMLALMSRNALSMVIDAVIIFYLMLPGVKSAFGKTSLFV